MGYTMIVLEIRETALYKRWFTSLRDKTAKAKILVRIRRVSLGNFGDIKSVGQGVSELRIDYGPGYRIYLMRHGKLIIILLCGGDKSTQTEDIKQAKSMAAAIKDGE